MRQCHETLGELCFQGDERDTTTQCNEWIGFWTRKKTKQNTMIQKDVIGEIREIGIWAIDERVVLYQC